MAKIIRRTWRSPGPLGRKVKHVAYGYQLMVNGTRERKVSSDWLTEQDAMTALNDRLKAIDAGQLGRPAQRTLEELAKEYRQYKRDQGKRTVDGDKRILEGRLLPALGKAVNVRTLTGQVLAQYEKRRAGQVSAYTVANELSLIRHMLRLAKRWGYVATVPEVTLPKKPEGRRRFVAEEELRWLLAACQGSRNPHLEAIATLAVHTGMRKGELLGLEWERIDLASARIVLYDTKNGAPRGVPMNRAVYDVLMRLGPTAEERTGLVFRRRSGLAWGQVRRAFQTAVTKAATPDFRFHDLRYTAASHMVMRGASLRDVQEVLGHKDFKMTLRYTHLSPAHLRGAVERLEGLTAPAGFNPTERVEASVPATS